MNEELDSLLLVKERGLVQPVGYDAKTTTLLNLKLACKQAVALKSRSFALSSFAQQAAAADGHL